MTEFAKKTALSFSPHLETARREGLFCALSGGADSVALLCVLLELQVPVRALHCNFQLRGDESFRDEEFVVRLCREKGVEMEVRRFDTRGEAKAAGESIEMAARRLRYAWFAETDRPVAVAHHADDNVETLLLNLLRGSGLRGLAAMRIDNGRGILRPLLGVTRAEVLAYLAELQQPFVEDSSNTDTAYRRNAIRHRILPQLRRIYPSCDRTLAQTLVRLQAAEEIYQIGLDCLSREWAPVIEGDKICFSLAPLAGRHPIGGTWLYEQLSPFGFDAVTVDAVFTARTGALFYTPTHCATRTATGLEIVPIGETTLPALHIDESVRTPDFHPSRRADVATVDASAIVGRLFLRRVVEGDRFAPYGMKHGTKLVSDYLTDRRRSRIDKFRALVVCDDRGILWLVGETIDRRVAVTPATTHIMTLQLKAAMP